MQHLRPLRGKGSCFLLPARDPGQPGLTHPPRSPSPAGHSKVRVCGPASTRIGVTKLRYHAACRTARIGHREQRRARGQTELAEVQRLLSDWLR